MRRVRGLLRISLSYNILLLFSTDASIYVSFSPSYWLGGGVIVCPGVKIGCRCVIGAGSVVTHDIPDNSVAAGNPARVIRTATDE